MDMFWRFFVYDAMPLIAIVFALGTAVRVVVVLGLRSDAISGLLDQQTPGTNLRSALAKLRGIGSKAPEFGLAELSSVSEPNRDQVIRVLGTAGAQFQRRIRPLEVWTSVSSYLTGVLLFFTLIYVAGALRSLMVGLSLEVEHSTTAILDVIGSVLAVALRGTWVVLCLFVLNTIIELRVNRRKERWANFANRLPGEVAEG
jgi:uncharacterized protein (DUF849 family)